MACFDPKRPVGNVHVEFLSSRSVDQRDVELLVQRDCRMETLIRAFSEDGLFGELAETDEDKAHRVISAREDPSTSVEIDLANIYCDRTSDTTDPVREYDTISAHLIAQSLQNDVKGDMASQFQARSDDSLDAAREQQNMAKRFAERPEFPSGFAMVLDSQDLLVASVAVWVVVSNRVRTVNMIGITTTLAVQLAGSCAATPRGVAKQVVDAVVAWGRTNGAVLHCVESPLFAMRRILSGKGFVSLETGFMANYIGPHKDITEATMAKICNTGFPRADQFYEPLGKVLKSSVLTPGVYVMEDIHRSKQANTLITLEVLSEQHALEKHPNYVTLFQDVTPGNTQQLYIHTQAQKRVRK